MSDRPQTAPRPVGAERGGLAVLRVVCGLLAIAFSFPAAYLVWRNFTSDADPLGLLFDERTLAPLWRTLRLAVAVSVSAAVLGTAVAWLTTRTDLAGRSIYRVLMPIPLVFPTFIGAAAFIRTMNPGGLVFRLFESVGIELGIELRGFFGSWLVLTLFTYPYVYLPVAARLRRLPSALEESARVLGDTMSQAFRRVVLPQIATSIAAGTLLVFLYTISDFGAVQLMRYDTLTRAIETNYLARPPVAFALSLMLLVLAAVVVIGENAMTRRLPADAGSRSSRTTEHGLGRFAIVGQLIVGITVVLGVIAPVAALIDWASGSGRPLTVDNATIVEASLNTLSVSVATAIVAVLAVAPIAFLVARRNDRFGRYAHAAVIATFALPGILIALALRFWTLRAGAIGNAFADTHAVLIFAYVVRFASLAMGVTLVAVRSVPDRLHDAASMLGADRMRRLRTVDLPLMGPGLLAAAGLVLLSTMKELPISLLIAPLGFQTLTTRIFGSFQEAFVAEAGIMALVLVAMSSVLTWFLVLRRADHL